MVRREGKRVVLCWGSFIHRSPCPRFRPVLGLGLLVKSAFRPNLSFVWKSTNTHPLTFTACQCFCVRLLMAVDPTIIGRRIVWTLSGVDSPSGREKIQGGQDVRMIPTLTRGLQLWIPRGIAGYLGQTFPVIPLPLNGCCLKSGFLQQCTL